jgi:hypothetical protein
MSPVVISLVGAESFCGRDNDAIRAGCATSSSGSGRFNSDMRKVD